MNANTDKILIDGNTATALGCVYAGATVAAWYPITPSTSAMDAFKGFCEKYRKDPETGKNNYIIIQAEDELAAIGMVIGASWNGARAFTSTAGPGISLMNELLGLAYYAEIPAVIIDVQRVGPSTGMPTRTQQGDILECAYASHGDTKHILLFPSNPAECFEFAPKAFDLAEHFQTPVFMLTDLDIGMNDWVVPRLKWDDSYRPDRGRVLNAEELEKITKFKRYSPRRRKPGGRPHAARRPPQRLVLHARLGPQQVRRLHRNARGISGSDGPAGAQAEGRRQFVPPPIIHRRAGANFGIITLGGCDPAVREALDRLAEQGVNADFMRIRGFPFDETVQSFLEMHDFCFVVEQNRDAQLRSLLTLETRVPKEKLRSILVYGGFPLSARHVVDGIFKALGEVEVPIVTVPIPELQIEE